MQNTKIITCQKCGMPLVVGTDVCSYCHAKIRGKAKRINQKVKREENRAVASSSLFAAGRKSASLSQTVKSKLAHPIVTYILIALNIAAFVWECIAGENNLTYQFAMYEGALQKGEWYRGVISSFLHFGIAHLTSNMICLFMFGLSLENKIGHWKYLLIYLAAIVGNTLLINFFGGIGRHAGASGAIWGLMTASLIYCLRNHKNPLFAIRNIALNLIYSFQGGVSWQGHIGGGIAGALIALVIINNVNQEYDCLCERKRPSGDPKG